MAHTGVKFHARVFDSKTHAQHLSLWCHQEPGFWLRFEPQTKVGPLLPSFSMCGLRRRVWVAGVCLASHKMNNTVLQVTQVPCLCWKDQKAPSTTSTWAFHSSETHLLWLPLTPGSFFSDLILLHGRKKKKRNFLMAKRGLKNHNFPMFYFSVITTSLC